jgi:hypothetical protein
MSPEASARQSIDALRYAAGRSRTLATLRDTLLPKLLSGKFSATAT